MAETADGFRRSGISEDWLAVILGLFIFLLTLTKFLGGDVCGWVVTTKVWTSLAGALKPVSDNYAGLPGLGSLLCTYMFLLLVLGVGAWRLRANVKKFALGFTLVFFISYFCWIIGAWAHIAATPNQLNSFGISWSMNLTSEAGYIVALIVGLMVGNFTPGFAKLMSEAIRPELYIKTAIVILGGFLGITAAEQLGLATSVMFRGLCAIVEAYLIYWALVYFVARKYFKFSREWSVPLASGISICGVSAAIATGSAIKARPVVPIMVSSLVVIFAVVELVLLPFIAQRFLYNEPMVAGAWMGLAVKTDGAAVASGAIAESLILAKAAAEQGINYQSGWVMATTTTVKVFIDVFIAIWAFILAWIWSAKIEKTGGEKMRAGEIWRRFPKFILGYMATFAAVILIAVSASELIGPAKAAMGQANVFRGIFFVMTFFTIGVVSNFRKLWEEGIGKLALVYVICLFGFIIWIGLVISWLFFAGVKPPLA
ncbi:MAG: putative sulfate exporter family transporter [Candidatus Zixiibacteriota bacterium]